MIAKINKSLWWHVTPSDPDAYKKRGKFLASTYLQAEFYGRPNDDPEKVNINRPVWGYSEKEILMKLFPDNHEELLSEVRVGPEDANWYSKRIELDRKMHEEAKTRGYDAIVLLCWNAKSYLLRNCKPPAIELNLMV